MPSRYPLLLLLLAIAVSLPAQRWRKNTEVPWPPERAYGRTTLGSALQRVFERHYDFCGFTKPSGKRDYTPPTIERFLGRRDLRSRVETADINGGNLLSYIFTDQETTAPLNAIRYRPDQLLFNKAAGINLLPEPRPGFDAFVLTKNCSGYLKSSLDAGLKPPYAAFQAALNTDAQRNSSVLAMAGSFLSPLAEILGANDARTTELMALLWLYYQDHPQQAGRAYYLRQFDGVVIKHLSDAREVTAAEQSVGINVSLPFAAKLSTSLTHGRTNENAFSGTDWRTVVFTDFAGPYTRQSFFERLPAPDEIEDYFRSRPLVTSADATPVPLREGGYHQHAVKVAGLPRKLASAGWVIENVRGQAYGEQPRLNVTATNQGGGPGLTFAVQALSSPDLFNAGREAIPLGYDLVLRAYGRELRIPVNRSFVASRHPLVDLAGTRFELRRANNGQYAFQYDLTLEVDDRENPLDVRARVEATDIRAGYDDQPLYLKVIGTSYDAPRRLIHVTLETERTWPLADIDDRNMRSFPLSLQVCLPVRDGYTLCRRPIESRIAVPRIRVRATNRLPD